MAHRTDFEAALYVTGFDLNEQIGELEVSDQRTLARLSNGGLIAGGTVAPLDPTPAMSVLVPPFEAVSIMGLGYWLNHISGALTVSLAKDGYFALNSGGVAGGNNVTLPTGSNEKWLTLAALFTREKDDERPSPVDQTAVHFKHYEAFWLRLVQGTAAAPGIATRPTLEQVLRPGQSDDGIILADIRLLSTTTAIGAADIAYNRVRSFSWKVGTSDTGQTTPTSGSPVLSQVYSWQESHWTGAPAAPTGGRLWNGRFVFTPYQDQSSRIEVLGVKFQSQQGAVAETTPTVIEVSGSPTFGDVDDFEVTLASGSGDSAYEAFVAPPLGLVRDCNLLANDTPIYWRFKPGNFGSHQNFTVGAEYARVA